MTTRSLISLLIFAPLLALLPSCASSGSSATESLLSAAGFRPKTPETAKQITLYNQLPSYKVQRGKMGDKYFYAYKDEKEGIAYVGNEEQYQKYQQLATQRRIALDQRRAAEMNRDMAYGWYGAYGPYYHRRHFYY